MKLNKKQIFYLAVLIAVCIATSVITHRCDRRNNQPGKVIKIARDTIIKYDTIPQYYPKPVEIEKVRTEYQWLPIAKIVHDTVGFTQFVKDSALVEVPITSKHYHGSEYDAWVSGYQPSLDSIKVYQRTEYVTETITRIKPPNKFSLDIRTGADYFTGPKDLWPYATANAEYNISNSRFSIGARGGVYYDTHEVKPFCGGYFKFRLL